MNGRSDSRTLFAITVLALVLRGPSLLTRPIWLDEWLTWDRSAGLLGPAQDWVPGTYAGLVWAGSELGLEPPLALRLPSLLGALVAVWAAAWMSRTWSRGSTAHWGAPLLVACAAGFVPYGHEGRPYSWAVAGAFGVVAALGPSGPKSRWLLVILGALGSAWTWTGMGVCALYCLMSAITGDRRARWLGLGVAVQACLTLPSLWAVPWAEINGVGPSVEVLQLADSTSFWFLGGAAQRLPGLGLGILVACALWARGSGSALVAMVTVPAVVLIGAHLAGFHPGGPTRHLLVLAPPWIVVLCHRLRSDQLVLVAVAGAGLAVLQAPGVPHHEVAPLIGHVGSGARLHVDPVLQRSWAAERGRVPDSGDWTSPEPRDIELPVWVVERVASPYSVPEGVSATVLHEAEGVQLSVWQRAARQLPPAAPHVEAPP